MNYIKLTFSGVLQYFFDNDSIPIKTTYNTSIYPTKQAIVGFLSSAFGYDRKDNKINELSNAIDIKYRVIKNPIILNDFQSISALKSQRYYMNKFHSKDQVLNLSNALIDLQLIKNVQYLQDAEFEIFIGCADDLLKSIYEALKNPVYSLYFGKRSCIPNKPIVTTYELIKKEDLQNVYDCA